MKKSTQIAINEAVISAMERYEKYAAENIGYDSVKPFRYCDAKVIKHGPFILLQSFKTIVAIIDEDRRCFDFLRKVYGYTQCSATQIAKFCRDYDAIIKYTYRKV